MFNSSISKLPVLFLARNKTFFQRKLTITPPLFKEKKKSDSPKLEKKTENKRKIFQEAKKKNYYKFLCKCGMGFNDFPEFLEHIKTSHQIENLDFVEIFAKSKKKDWPIKFYWHLSCQCGHKFSSSLCNADLKVNKEQIEIVKKYRLQCLKCKKYAKFDNEELLAEFLKERVKQKLIYSFYEKEFNKYKGDGGKKLEGHIQELCEKCKELRRHCGSGSDYQEQLSQIGYISPFMSIYKGISKR